MNYTDKLGVYRVGDLRFYSKLEAIEYMQKTGIHLHWDFNEVVFSSYDWTIEPKENILELYRQRAQQLRDTYDYIIVMYSGGADSQTVVESFVDNDIKLDEVASYSNYQASGNKQDYMNAEIYNVAIPNSEKLTNRYPWIKHRVIDLSELTMEKFSLPNTKFDWIYEVNMYLSTNALTRESLGLKIKEWADIINSGKRLCIVWGKDKPRIHFANGKFFMRFIDFIDDAATVKSIAGQLPYTDEFFYWTPDLPKIVIKQAHLIKNYLRGDLTHSPFISHNKSDLAFVEKNNKKYWLSNHGVHSLIYPKWNTNTFTVGKVLSNVFTLRDKWFYNFGSTEPVKQSWRTGLNKLWKCVPMYWKNDPTDVSKGIKACWSKNYYIGDLDE